MGHDPVIAGDEPGRHAQKRGTHCMGNRGNERFSCGSAGLSEWDAVARYVSILRESFSSKHVPTIRQIAAVPKELS